MLTGEPFNPAKVRTLVRQAIQSGTVTPSGHFKDEAKKDGLTIVDATNVLRCGFAEPGELERGTYRYRVATQKITVVVAFRSLTGVALVTIWKNKK